MPYPPAIAETLRKELRLDGTGRLLDVGCGPGSLTLMLAPLFAETTAIDADEGMITEARRQDERGAVSWHRLRAEDIPADWGPFQVVTFAQSIHWLDQATVLPLVHSMMAPGGVCVHVQGTTHAGTANADSTPYPTPPHDAIATLIADFLGPVRRAGRGTLPAGTPGTEVDQLRAAGFTGPSRVEVDWDEVLTRTEDQVVASVLSLSSATPHLFGQRLPEFDRKLRELLRGASPSGLFSERLPPMALDFWRP
jgi:SAM-dependent methyltransferase